MATTMRSTAGTLNGAATNAVVEPAPEALRFAVYQENSGRYSWHLTAGDEHQLARSCQSFASRDDAERAVEPLRQLSAGVGA